MRNIIELNLTKTSTEIDTASYSHIDLSNASNIKLIQKYVIPIIAENDGWDTKDLTLTEFDKNPLQFQESLDSTLFSNVHIMLEDDKPVGLLEYLEETLDNPKSLERMSNLNKLISDKTEWEELLGLGIIDKVILTKHHPKLNECLSSRKLYSEIGVVVRPELQGKKSGVSDELYGVLKDGVCFGWTNNPIIVRQWKKIFNSTEYFPSLGERPNSLEHVVNLAILYADLLTYTDRTWRGLEFGALDSPYFVSRQGSHYMDVAKKLYSEGKLSDLDFKRIEYCIQKGAVQGAIFAHT
jgi:hypothetical protein